MHSIESLMGMIATDAIERGGEPEIHHADESKNKQHPYLEKTLSKKKSTLPPIRYHTELIQNPDGSYEWID